MKEFVYRFEPAFDAAVLAARTAASDLARARAAVAACESASLATHARPTGEVPQAVLGGVVRDLEFSAERAIGVARALVAASARARCDLDSARASYDRAEICRSTLERHRDRFRAHVARDRLGREEREREDAEAVRRMR